MAMTKREYWNELWSHTIVILIEWKKFFRVVGLYTIKGWNWAMSNNPECVRHGHQWKVNVTKGYRQCGRCSELDEWNRR